ncbi:hypothetical protein GJ496_009445 [Pomphorhynchus laevis]|nr:hypothetical protein GJ496_009445 [Pomphorhynchus laevis]
MRRLNNPADQAVQHGCNLRPHNLSKMMQNLNISAVYTNNRQLPSSTQRASILHPRNSYNDAYALNKRESTIKSQKVAKRQTEVSIPSKRKSSAYISSITKRKSEESYGNQCNTQLSDNYSLSSGQFSMNSDKTMSHLESELARLRSEIERMKKNEAKLSSRVQSRSNNQASDTTTIQTLRKQNSEFCSTIEQIRKECKDKSLIIAKKDAEISNLKRQCRCKVLSRSETSTSISDNSKKLSEKRKLNETLSTKTSRNKVEKKYWDIVRQKIIDWTVLQDLKTVLETELNVVGKQYAKLQRKRIDVIRLQMQQSTNNNQTSRKRKGTDILKNIEYNIKYLLQRTQECENELDRLSVENKDPIKSFNDLIEEIPTIRELKNLLCLLFKDSLEIHSEASKYKKTNLLLLQENREFEQTKILRVNAMQPMILQTSSDFEVDEIILAPVLDDGDSDEENMFDG